MDNQLQFFYWPAQIFTDLELKELSSKLSSSEQKTALRAKSLKRQSEIIKGRSLLRSVFQKFCNLELPNSLDVSKSGKPLAPQGYFFNISHSHNIITLVVGRNGDLGIDVEVCNPNRNYLEIAKNYGTEKEFSELEKTPLTDRPDVFYSQWCLKEAYSKATGEGLSASLTDLEFCLNENRFSHRIKKPNCYFHYLNLLENHVGICHFSKEILKLHTHEVTLSKNDFLFSLKNVSLRTIT